LGLGVVHRQAQPRVHGRVGQARLGGDGDVPRQLGEQLGPLRVGAALAVHDVLEFGMAGHEDSFWVRGKSEARRLADGGAAVTGQEPPASPGIPALTPPEPVMTAEDAILDADLYTDDDPEEADLVGWY